MSFQQRAALLGALALVGGILVAGRNFHQLTEGSDSLHLVGEAGLLLCLALVGVAGALLAVHYVEDLKSARIVAGALALTLVTLLWRYWERGYHSVLDPAQETAVIRWGILACLAGQIVSLLLARFDESRPPEVEVVGQPRPPSLIHPN